MRRPLLALFFACCLATPALAGSLAGVTLADTTKVGAQDLVLNGLGLRKKFFIKVYVGGLYLPAKQADAAKVMEGDTTRRMEMSFLYGVSASQMCDGWNEGLEGNSPNAAAEVKEGFKTLCSWMEDIPKGNEMTATYTPGEGTRIEVNGKLKGTLPGKATADALLACWLGPNPGPGEDFKKGVLGG